MFARYALIEVDPKIRGFFSGKSFETVLYGNLVGFDHSGHLWISQFMVFPVLQFFCLHGMIFLGFGAATTPLRDRMKDVRHVSNGT